MKHLNYRQIRALIKKDILVRLRQPWMTFLSIIWPCAIFLSLYILRLRFKPYQVGDCQFPTRQLPANDLLPFFQSYICTIENQCLDFNKYEEVSNWMEAPVTPVLNIVQTLLNEKDLYKAIIDLPNTMEFVSLVTKLATHPKFKYIESNADYIVKHLPEVRKAMGNNFDVKQVFSNDGIFSNLGKVLCGKSFPRSNNIRYVDNILYTPDMNKDRPDKDELDVMPTPYCKQLYLDVTNSNNGKITWKILKPIIQGKIIYGPVTDETKLIVSYANKTMDDMYRLRLFFRSIETSINMLNTNEKFRAKFDGLINLAKTPFVKAILGDSVDIDSIESVLNSVITDKQVLDIVKTIGDIFDCYNVDRFIPVNSEKELEDIAYELAKKKLFYAAFYFDTDSVTNEVTYKLRMEVDNTPVTVENRNRFWFPGPEASFELEMRYHRGFIELQNAIEIGIIKAKKHRQFDALRSKVSTTTPFAPDDLQFSDEEDLLFDDFYENNETSVHHETSTASAADTDDFDDLSFDDLSENKSNESESTTTAKTATFDLGNLLFALGNPSAVTKSPQELDEFDEDSDFWNSDDNDNDTTISSSKVRRKRQFDGLLGLFGIGNNAPKKQNPDVLEFKVDEMRFFTKQFPYPKYTRDDFKKGLYLAQAIQMAFFFALIILISSSVRQKIWFKESGNLSLMRTMGLCESSEIVSWIITTFVELAIVFFLCLVILYTGGIMQYTSKLLVYIYLLIFGLCVISFCYMASTFFSTASIGSVSTVILFLMTFLPYIIIISLGAVLSSLGKFIASLSMSTAFCYAWHYIFRTELQEKSLTLFNAFSDDTDDNDLRFGILMIIFDTFLYAAIGFLNKKFSSSSNKFYKVQRKNISKDLGAEMKKVTKVYDGCDPNKPAVESVSINFKKDQILCLLGRNGAGKSTIIKLLTGEIAPTLGEINLPLDYDLITGFENEQEQVGLCPQGNVLIPDLTAREHLELYAHIKFKKEHRKEVRRVMNNMKLGKYKDYKVSALSGGYKRRLCISIAFLGSPNFVILDEPCSAVDVSARKVIWDLIETLRKNRAVVMSTHDLDEAQHLGDQIIMMKDGRIAMEATTKDLHDELTKNFSLNVELKASISTDKETIDEVKGVIVSHYKKDANVMVKDCMLNAVLPYFDEESKKMDYGDLFRALEKLQTDKKIVNFSITSKTLESYYKSIENDAVPIINGHSNGHHNNNNNNNMETIDLRKAKNGHQNGNFKGTHDNKAPFRDIVSSLFLKRFLHFRRNYRLLICIMLLPVIFEVIAMTFMIIRPPGDYDNQVEFNRSMYPNSVEFYSKQNSDSFTEIVYEDFEDTCTVNENCNLFDSSKESYEWLIQTHDEYTRKRYGGISINQSKSMVWYNNKGYHSMPLYLNILSSAIIKKELNDSSYNIRAINHPLKLGEDELSVSSILQQVADAGISLILLVSFSLVIAGASVFIVNERISGEKLQQQLCGVRYQIYWGVAFIWDFVIYTFAIICAVIVFYIFNIPIYVEGDNLGGIVLLLFAFGFAMIPYVHLFEKLFNEASFANMSIFCLNVIMALTTVSIIIMFDVLSETDEHERIRNFLNRLFLIFPQHALADGLIEICRNHIMSKIFIRYYINTYRSPITSDLLRPHYTALIALGITFIVLNYIVESGIIWTLFKNQPKQSSTELKVITIQNTLTKDGKVNEARNDNILKVENLYKSYNGNEFAVNNVSFNVKKGECYGCLGTNGAGKSTVFSILSGETKRFGGTIQLASDVDKYSISYCPQSNALDPLLTVEEVMRFYGKLRNIKDLDGLVESGLDNFHLKPYRNVLVKNLSGGNRRKLSVACSSFGNLSLVLMDEPVSDMDPITRYLVYKTIKELNDENCSVILTSHSIAEIEDVCHSIGILVDGNMVASGSPERLKKEFGNKYVVTILSEKPLDYHFETDLRKTFRSMKNTVCHQYSAQFLMQVRDFENVDHCHIKLSELIDLLNAFTTVKDLKYTITACMIDQVYESIIKRGVMGIDNNGYVQNEYNVT